MQIVYLALHFIIQTLAQHVQLIMLDLLEPAPIHLLALIVIVQLVLPHLALTAVLYVIVRIY